MTYNVSAFPPQFSEYLSTILTSNLTTTPEGDLDLFFQCWIRPHCPACLSPNNPYPCSWCETSQTCVPNTVFKYPFGILAPIRTDTICPLGWKERWELRARPFSCRCSSMTFVSVVVAVVATLIGVLLIWVGILFGRWIGRKWRARKVGWWRPSNWAPRWIRREKRDLPTETVAEAHSSAEETTPLLA